MEFIESPLFSRIAPRYLDDDEYAALQWALIIKPDAGAVIKGSGGIRKLRWSGKGHGKRGGLRVIYYWQIKNEIWLLTIYSKNETSDIAPERLKAFREEIDQ